MVILVLKFNLSVDLMQSDVLWECFGLVSELINRWHPLKLLSLPSSKIWYLICTEKDQRIYNYINYHSLCLGFTHFKYYVIYPIHTISCQLWYVHQCICVSNGILPLLYPCTTGIRSRGAGSYSLPPPSP